MALDASIKALYAPGGATYNNIAAQWGQAAADEAYRVSKTARERAEITEALQKYHDHVVVPGSSSSIGNFFTQITTDPLAAPLESANNHIGKAVLNVFKNPWVFLAIAAWLFHTFGGFDWLKRKVARA